MCVPQSNMSNMNISAGSSHHVTADITVSSSSDFLIQHASSPLSVKNKNAALLQRLRTNTCLMMTDASKHPPENGEILQRAQRGSKPGVTKRAEIKARRAANMQPAEESHRGASPLKLYLGQILLCRTNRVPRCIHTTQPRSINTTPPRWASSTLILSASQTRRFHRGTDACWETGSRTREQNVLPGTSGCF